MTMKRIRAWIDWAVRHQLHWDALSATGLLLVVGGVAAFSLPAACILLGVALLWLGVLGARLWAVVRRPQQDD
jgi:hypothetical protein